MEDTRQQDDYQKQLEQSFVENTKEQQGEIYLTQKEEEEALMQSLLGNNTSKMPIKSSLKAKSKTNKDDYKTSPYIKDEWQCVYEESELAHIEVPQIEIQLISFEEEEDFERESINQMIKDYYKAMRYLFTKYVQTEK